MHDIKTKLEMTYDINNSFVFLLAGVHGKLRQKVTLGDLNQLAIVPLEVQVYQLNVFTLNNFHYITSLFNLFLFSNVILARYFI
jgi:hypothetical protein